MIEGFVGGNAPERDAVETWPSGMPYKSPVRHFKTWSDVIRPAVMLYMRFTLFFRNVDDLLHQRAISVAYDPLTDIGLADQTAYDPSAFDMLPQIGVRCLARRDEKPFELVEPETR